MPVNINLLCHFISRLWNGCANTLHLRLHEREKKQCTYKRNVRRVHITIVAVEKQ